MKLTLEELSQVVEGELVRRNDKVKTVTNASGLAEAGLSDVSFLGNMKYLDTAKNTKAGVIFISKDIDDSQFDSINLIKVANSQYAYGIVLELIAKERLAAFKNEVSPKSSVSPDALIAPNVYIGAFSIVEASVEIGAGTKILANVYIGQRSKIGANCVIYPNVVIREDTVIGDSVILQPGVIVGGDGFGFATVNEVNKKIPQIGNVVIGNDVEIGANTTIDRATTNSTKIGDGTKIDNLVQIAHNVEIGKNCLIVAQAGIAGSTKIGNSTIIGGQTGVAGHLTIGDNVTVAGQSAVSASLKDGQKVGGNPIAELGQSIKIRATMRKLTQMYKDIRVLKDKMGDK
ncbi:MAG: UDP-3-O-(3-hydroxymyristoyl)glucosamine N-acyltransferase [Elusimicrobiota bacterium]|jgi:UDP-3-O-[3-hydroxymyristoyl] glucosamine N-acyltransferase|nr:UDP-3-O-(3-hydroxymyristoyl)glucosamine N-acyltransferase [Elusimicrobiota bacterium]